MSPYYFYLVATVFFVLGIKGLCKVKTARNGNRMAAIGMLLAVIGVVVEMQSGGGAGLSWVWTIAGLAIGGGIGFVLASRVEMTAMPELVAAFNGLGGVASTFVATASVVYFATMLRGEMTLGDRGVLNAIMLPATILIGTATLTGSFIAFFKLAGKKIAHPIPPGSRNTVNLVLAVVVIAAGAMMLFGVNGGFMLGLLTVIVVVVSGILGVLLVLPIGGADMPVVVALLNSYSGIAAAASGFIIFNPMLIVAGALVGASGLILTKIMCKAMNRSLGNVLMGGMGDENQAEDAREYNNVKETSAEEVAMLFDGASSVIFVPGYGLAVAQAQHTIRELGELLEKRGVNVRYAIHPVAGRMPGHMNVLLAEADVSYDKLWELERINSDFQNTDVVVIVGANDVVNPAAREDPQSPIAGMPILDVDFAQTVVVIKRSLSPGYAGIRNPLFDKDNCLMVFADAKAALSDMVTEVKDL